MVWAETILVFHFSWTTPMADFLDDQIIDAAKFDNLVIWE